ncbi:unnamed protein product [Brachionus calyciflorus]|uniref:Uncharacterized protein n=1 Tax=Brachionus calyciflorus TaxID=104777 RepID=A0A814NIJ1_9BILA|nr:unnamed protein product [Brachionus calyciflorus]
MFFQEDNIEIEDDGDKHTVLENSNNQEEVDNEKLSHNDLSEDDCLHGIRPELLKIIENEVKLKDSTAKKFNHT